jgi:hypothetical protein
MTTSVISVDEDTVTIQMQVKLSGSMLDMEAEILGTLNEAGCLATKAALERFDTDGSRIEFGGVKWFSKGQLPKKYQTPYGEMEIERHVYQRSGGRKDVLSSGARCPNCRHINPSICKNGVAQVCKYRINGSKARSPGKSWERLRTLILARPCGSSWRDSTSQRGDMALRDTSARHSRVYYSRRTGRYMYVSV